MGQVTIHGGDFANGEAWFYPRGTNAGGFVVRTKDNRPACISIEDLAVAERATAEWVRALGGDEAMVDALEQLAADERARAFVALFTDGRMLLGSTDGETRAQLCADHSGRLR